jgi:hypothetical protein
MRSRHILFILLTASLLGCAEPAQEDSDGPPCGIAGCPAPALDVALALELPATPLGQMSGAPLTLKNSGAAPLHITQLALTGDDAIQVELPTLPLTIGPGLATTIMARYTPRGGAAHRAELHILSDDPLTPQRVVQLRAAVQPPACETVSGTLDFGELQIAQHARRALVVRNCSASEAMNVKLRLDADEASVTFDEDIEPLLISTSPRGWQLKPGEQLSFGLNLTPQRLGDDLGSLELRHAQQSQPNAATHLPITAQVKPRSCPVAVATLTPTLAPNSVAQFEPLRLDATSSEPVEADATPLTYTWQLLDKPTGSTLTIKDPSAALQDGLIADEPGRYTFALSVAQGDVQGCETIQLKVDAISSDGVFILLEWDRSPGGDADLDLHYLNRYATSWGAAPWDIFSQNRSADWGVLGDATDDPWLNRDDARGGLGELIHQRYPEHSAYQIGVQYVSDGGAGPVTPRIRVYAHHTLLYRSERITLEEGDFLLLGQLVPAQGGHSFTVEETITHGPPQP